MSKQHALLSPSAASRWLTCTPSAVWESEYPDISSAAADEGTLAHTFGELYVRNFLKTISEVNYKRELKKARNNQYHSVELESHAMDYANFVLEKYADMDEAEIFVEEIADLTDFVPDGFGTVDITIVMMWLLEIVDFKYGKGVLVEAHENNQMKLYALGVLKKYREKYDIQTVRMTIYQPRLNNYGTFEMSADDLLEWGENYVKPQALIASLGAGEFVAGGHCKFCKAKNDCRALMDYNMELAKYAFEDPNKLNDDDIANILDRAADFKNWLTSITDYALYQATKQGKKWPGFKLVAGRSGRVVTNKEKVVDVLKTQVMLGEIESEDLFLSKPELLGITALEANLGSHTVNDLVGGYIIKPGGKPTLVHDWDKRLELSGAEAAKAAFESVEIIDI